MPDAPADVTRLIHNLHAGNAADQKRLFDAVYHELHRLAHAQRRQWQGDYTLNTTALVHEAYIKLVDQSQARYEDRGHFLAVASQAMRRILIDYARARKARKRGGGLTRLDLDDVLAVSDEKVDELLALDIALTKLAALDERQARVVECRFFGGMTIPETAAALGVSPATVKRDWMTAQAFLYREMQHTDANTSES